MTQEALNIAGQCRATASSPLAKNILVDEGNGLLTELLLDAARIIEALAQPEQEPVKWSDYEPDGMHHNKPQKRPQNCGTGYCSCIECVMEPPQRTWVWLNKVERIELLESTHPNNRWSLLALCEAKLKEKNT